MDEYSFEIAWLTMGFFLNEFFIDAMANNWPGAAIDVAVVLFMAWTVKDNYDE